LQWLALAPPGERKKELQRPGPNNDYFGEELAEGIPSEDIL